MDVEFGTIFEHLGWSSVAPIHELGSRLLTIQILGTLQIVDYGIYLPLLWKRFRYLLEGSCQPFGFPRVVLH